MLETKESRSLYQQGVMAHLDACGHDSVHLAFARERRGARGHLCLCRHDVLVHVWWNVSIVILQLAPSNRGAE
jgi:hypothetical protein